MLEEAERRRAIPPQSITFLWEKWMKLEHSVGDLQSTKRISAFRLDQWRTIHSQFSDDPLPPRPHHIAFGGGAALLDLRNRLAFLHSKPVTAIEFSTASGASRYWLEEESTGIRQTQLPKQPKRNRPRTQVVETGSGAIPKSLADLLSILPPWPTRAAATDLDFLMSSLKSIKIPEVDLDEVEPVQVLLPLHAYARADIGFDRTEGGTRRSIYRERLQNKRRKVAASL